MTLFDLCCQNAVALTAEYDEELHVFTRIAETPNPAFIPLGARNGSGTATKARLSSWWHGRAIPVTRDGFRTLEADLDGLSPMDLLDRSLGLSLSDQYWLRPQGSRLLWEEVNFFDNGFDGQLGLLTLGSLGSFTRKTLDASPLNPNSSLGGNLKKAWEKKGDVIRLVKAGSAPFEQEPVNEAIATALHRRLLQPTDFTPYHLEQRDERLYSICPDMVDRDECLVPAWDIINAAKRPGHLSPWQNLLKRYDELGVPAAREQLEKVFVCDYLIANHDRHWNNLGVIFDARTMEAKRVAPIFDSGSSLWCDAPELVVPRDYWYRPLPLVNERARRIQPEEQLALMTDLSWLSLEKLEGFAEEAARILAQHGKLPPERVEAIRRGIERNIEHLAAYVRRVRNGK